MKISRVALIARPGGIGNGLSIEAARHSRQGIMP
jgi:hypothetical protein